MKRLDKILSQWISKEKEVKKKGRGLYQKLWQELEVWHGMWYYYYHFNTEYMLFIFISIYMYKGALWQSQHLLSF